MGFYDVVNENVTTKLDNSTHMWKLALKRAIKVLREEGVRDLWFKILGGTVYRRLILIEHPLDKPIPEVTARIPVVISLLKEAEVDEYINFCNEATPSEISYRLKTGQWCFVARYEGRIVHSCWATTNRGWIEYLEREIQLTPNEIYIYEVFTSPNFRGQNISPARRVQMLRYFRDVGYRRVISAILPENKAAFRSLEKSVYYQSGTIGYIKIGSWRHDFYRVRHNL